MANGDLNWITNYIWGIADDVLRDLYVLQRGCGFPKPVEPKGMIGASASEETYPAVAGGTALVRFGWRKRSATHKTPGIERYWRATTEFQSFPLAGNFKIGTR